MNLNDKLAVDRTLLANVRTLLAFIRTALALIASGLGLRELFHSVVSEGIAWLLVFVGLLTAFIGFKKYQAMASRIRNANPKN